MLATQLAPRIEDPPIEGEALVSPFGAATLAPDGPATRAYEREDYAAMPLASPFAEAMAVADEGAWKALSFEAVMAELEDEGFDEAIQGLVDEAAARHLSSSASWSSEAEAAQLAAGDVEAWIGGVGAEADRLLERLEQQFAQATYETFDEAYFEAEGLRHITEAGVNSLATEQFLGKLVRKAKGLVKGAVNLAKKGLKAVGKLLPIGKIFNALRKLVQPLLKRVLQMAIGRLPASVQPAARALAAKLFGSREAEAPYTGQLPANELTETTEAFDARLAEALLAPTDTGAQQLVDEAEAETQVAPHDPLAALDAARARLASEFEAATPGVSPVAQVEQFIPVVMAALPIIRLGLTVIGRDKVVRFLADKLAGLIKGHIGAQAAQMLARPIVDIGLRMLTLEAESSGGAAAVGAEAMVATVEDTIRTLAELPAEAFEDPLRLEAETQEAFAAAAARHVPRALLARQLPVVETSDGRGVWVYMPRATRPCYRYKKFTHVYQVPITQPAARAIRFPAGDTLERRLLDAGARVWPVQSEVHLFETLPGTQLGHLAAFEDERGAADAAGVASEFEALTPEVAAMLVKEPGLGAAPRGPRARRLFRVVVPGTRVRRARRFVLRLDTSGPAPVARLHVRLSERESHEAAAALARKAHAQVVAQFRATLGPAFRAALTSRLARHLAAKAGTAVPPDRPAALAESMVNGALSALSASLPASELTLIQAARDAARGITLTFAFGFADKAALVSGAPAAPSLAIRAGWQRD